MSNQIKPSSSVLANILTITIISTVVIVDQATKQMVSHFMQLYQSVPITRFLTIRLMHNTGAAFSVLANQGRWAVILLTGFAIIASILIGVWLIGLGKAGVDRVMQFAASLVLGGAIGNLIDRLHYGYVIDFIGLHYAHWYWPAFNVADSAISVGMGVLLFRYLLYHQRSIDRRGG